MAAKKLPSRTDYALLKAGADWRNPRSGWTQRWTSPNRYGSFASCFTARSEHDILAFRSTLGSKHATDRIVELRGRPLSPNTRASKHRTR